jgi:hypothetical protein
MRPSEINDFCNDIILERTMQITQGELGHGHPTVLSCGGIFVPRPKPINPKDPLYHILYTPNEDTPTKIVSALITRDILDEVLDKTESN